MATRRTASKNATQAQKANPVEAALDRILVKRLRPLRDDVTKARRSFEEQVVLRVEAEKRAERAEDRLAVAYDEAAALRTHIGELEAALESLQQRRVGWLRRRRVIELPDS